MNNNHIKRLSTNLGLVFILFFTNFMVQAKVDQQSKIYTDSKADYIEALAKQFIKTELLNESDAESHILIREIDNRVKIPACSDQYRLTAPNYNPRVSTFSVKVSCDSIDWYTFLNASISQTQQVVVSNNTLSPGEVLNTSNLVLANLNKQRLRGSTFDSVDIVEGARLKRRVREGTIITANMLCFVCKGDRVTVTAVSNGLAIKASAIAMEDGNLGDTIQVENNNTERVIRARVISSSNVEIRI